MTFRGTLAGVNTALNGLTYTPPANFSGSATLTVTTNDLGNSGSGGPLGDSDTVSIAVSSVNDAPINTVPGTQTISEDSTRSFSSGNGNAISISDDAGTNPVQVALTVTSGTLTLAGTSGLTFTAGANGSSAMTISGTLSSINAAINGLIYTPAANFSGSATLTVTSNDLGNTGSGGALGDTDAVVITVTGVNDLPVNTVPGPQSGSENTSLVFSSAGGNAISVSDIDAGSSPIQVSLAITDGTLSLAGTSGLTFSSGDGTADSTMTFSGTLADINAALNGLSYTPTPNFGGPATLTVTSNDLGSTGSGGSLSDTDTVALNINSVNDAPTNTVPGPQTTNEDTSLVFSSTIGNAISITDDAGSNPIQATLSVTSGTLTLAGTSGLTFSGGANGSSTMTVSGTLAGINAALNGLIYTPPAHFNGSATLTITTSDLGHSGSGGPLGDSDTVDIAISSENDAPINTVPGTQTTNENTSRVFSNGNGNAISITDIDAGTNPIEVTLAVTGGTLSLAGTSGLAFSTGDGVADSTMTFTGTLADINTALNGLTYTPAADFGGSVSLTIASNDLGNSGGAPAADTDTVTINVASINDAPVNSVPGSQSTNEESALVFATVTGTSISVADDAGINPIRVSLGVTNGTLTLGNTSGLTFSAGENGSSAMTFTGTLATINAGLNGLTYAPTPDFSGSATLTISTNDLGNTGSGGPLADTDTVAITVNPLNDSPARTGGSFAGINADEDSASFPASLGLSSLAYGPGGGSDETGQTLSYRVTAIPSFIQLFLADGITPVPANTLLSDVSALRGLHHQSDQRRSRADRWIAGGHQRQRRWRQHDGGHTRSFRPELRTRWRQ
jgi:hypothetical protein